MTEEERRKKNDYQRRWRAEHHEELLRQSREWRLRNPEKVAERKRRHNQSGYGTICARAYRARHPDRSPAHHAVFRAVRKGVLVRPTSCSQCHRECKPQAHHRDYSKPLDVVWLCRPCHLAEDGRQARVWRKGDPK